MSEEKDIQNEENLNEATENQEESTLDTTLDAAETEDKNYMPNLKILEDGQIKNVWI